jgi:2-methylcitrate dehydratase PrpD
LLAKLGYLGSESFLDGEKGYWVMAGSDRCDFDLMTDFREFEILTVSLKPYPCCRWIHTTLDAIDALQAKAEIKPEEIDWVDVYSILPLAEFFGKTELKSFVDMEFSVPCSIALKLYRVPLPDWFLPRNWKNPKILDLARKVHVKLEDKYQEIFVSRNRNSVLIPSRIEVVLKGGRKLEGYEDVASGSPLRPMSPEGRLGKFRDLTAMTLSKESQEEVIKLVTNLEKVERIDEITRLL